MLNDLSLVEISSFVASPTVGLYCAQMGADVVRVDQIGGGLDYDRYMLGPNDRSLSWENLNRGKRSVALDLRSAEGRELAVELARATGQLVTNVPKGSFLDHATIAKGRADLVSLRIMGWHDGRQAMDFTVNAASGYPLMTGPAEWDQRDAPPVNQVLPAWDFITGAYGAFALLAALRRRDATGEGAELKLPLGDVALGTLANSGAMAEMLLRGDDRERLGNAIWGSFGRDFTTRDGQRLMVAALTAKQWNALVDALGLRAEIEAIEARAGYRLADRDHYRFVHREELFPLFERAFAAEDYAPLAEKLAAAGATFERYRTAHEAARDPELVGANPLFSEPDGNPSMLTYPAPGPFAHIADSERTPARPAPYLGADSEAVLAERLGMGSGAIGDLIDRGVVATSDEETA